MRKLTSEELRKIEPILRQLGTGEIDFSEATERIARLVKVPKHTARAWIDQTSQGKNRRQEIYQDLVEERINTREAASRLDRPESIVKAILTQLPAQQRKRQEQAAELQGQINEVLECLVAGEINVEEAVRLLRSQLSENKVQGLLVQHPRVQAWRSEVLRRLANQELKRAEAGKLLGVGPTWIAKHLAESGLIATGDERNTILDRLLSGDPDITREGAERILGTNSIGLSRMLGRRSEDVTGTVRPRLPRSSPKERLASEQP